MRKAAALTEAVQMCWVVCKVMCYVVCKMMSWAVCKVTCYVVSKMMSVRRSASADGRARHDVA